MSRSFGSSASIFSRYQSTRRDARRRAVLELERATIGVETLEPRWLLSGSRFANPADYTLGVSSLPVSTVIADVNGDGKPDIVTLSSNGDVTVLLGNGDGTFQRAQSVPDLTPGTSGSYYQGQLAVADVNHQEVIFAANLDSEVVTVLQVDNGILHVRGAITTGPASSGIVSMTVAEVNGVQDLIAGDITDAITITQLVQSTSPGFQGTIGTSTISDAMPSSTILNPITSVAVGNFILGGDDADLVATDGYGVADIFPGAVGGFGPGTQITAVSGGADLYNAGPGNLLVRNLDGTITPLFGQGGSVAATAFTDPEGTITPGIFADRLAVGDFNGDGIPDFAVTNGYSSFQVFNGNGAGVYTAAHTYATASKFAFSMAAADLRGDGVSDVVMGYSSVSNKPGFVGVRLNQTPVAPTFTSGSFVFANALTPFSFTITTTGISAPALFLEGGSLPQGLTFKDNGNGTATISGTPNPYGNTTYNLVFAAKNSAGVTDQSFTLLIFQKPSFTTPSSITLTAGTAMTPFLVKTTGGFPLPALSEIGALPAGITFTDNGNGTATISGTPAVTGVFNFNIQASNIAFTTTQAFNLTVTAKPAFPAAAIGELFTDGISGSTGPIDGSNGGLAFPIPTLSVTGGVIPAGLFFIDNGNGTGQFSGTPQFSDAGQYMVKVTAQNSAGSATVLVYLNIAQQPVITSANATQFIAGKAGSFTVQSIGNSGFGVPSFDNSIDPNNGLTGALPAGVSFKDNGNGTATISGTPAIGSGGIYVVQITTDSDVGGLNWAFLGLTPATQTFVLVVNQTPAFTTSSASYTVGSGSPIAPITLSTSGAAGSVILQLTGGSLPQGLTFLDNGNGTATISGTPFVGTAGTYNLTITASNSAGSAIEKVALTVIDPPIFTNGVSATFTEGTAGTFAFTTKPTATPPAIVVNGAYIFGTATPVSLLSLGLKFKDNGNGTAALSGTPVSGSGGSYQIFVLATNSFGLTGGFAIKLTILSRPVLFVPTPSTSVPVGDTTSIGITATNEGPTPPSIYIASGALPPGLTFVDNGDGTATISGIPSAGDAGPYTVYFNAKNSVGTAINGPQSLTIQVPAQPFITSAPAVTFTVGQSFQTFKFTSTGNSGVGVPSFNSALNAANGLFGTLPAGVTFKDNGNGTATLTGTPAPGTGGVYPLQLESVSDVNGIIFGSVGELPAIQNFTLTVNEAPTFASNTASAIILAGTPFAQTIATKTGYGTPSLKITSGSLPAGMTFTNNGDGTATIKGTPAANAAGVYNFVIVATNQSGNATFNEKLQVDQAPGFAPGTSLNVSLTHGKTVGLVFNLTGFPTPDSFFPGSLSGLPPGLTLAPNSNGTELILKGTPTTTGSFNVTFTLQNSDGFVSSLFDMLITIT